VTGATFEPGAPIALERRHLGMVIKLRVLHQADLPITIPASAVVEGWRKAHGPSAILKLGTSSHSHARAQMRGSIRAPASTCRARLGLPQSQVFRAAHVRRISRAARLGPGCAMTNPTCPVNDRAPEPHSLRQTELHAHRTSASQINTTGFPPVDTAAEECRAPRPSSEFAKAWRSARVSKWTSAMR